MASKEVEKIQTEVIGGKYLKIKMCRCRASGCTHYKDLEACPQVKLMILNQKYGLEKFGITDPTIHRPTGVNTFKVDGIALRLISQWGNPGLDGNTLAVKSGPDSVPEYVNCIYAPIASIRDKLRLLVTEYNYKKALEEAKRGEGRR